MKSFIKKSGFTLVETLIGVVLTSIVFLIVMVFLSNTFSNNFQKKDTVMQVSTFLKFREDIQDFVDKGYKNAEILFESDIKETLYLKHIDPEKGAVVFSRIDDTNLKIQTDANSKSNRIGYAYIGKQGVIDIQNDYQSLLNKVFSSGHTYKDMYFKDFDVNVDANLKLLDLKAEVYTDSSQKQQETKKYQLLYNLN